MSYYIDRKSQGIYYQEWVKRVAELFSDHSTPFPPDPKELEQLFHRDYGCEEALWKAYVKGHIHAYMEVHVKHEYGRFSNTFNREHARVFFAKFPEISKALD